MSQAEHNFNDSLRDENSPEVVSAYHDLWSRFMAEIGRSVLSIRDIDPDAVSSDDLKLKQQFLKAQGWGVDRIIRTDKGPVWVEEKRRRTYYEDDVLFEYSHTNGTAGWSRKEGQIYHYFAYVLAPVQRAWVFEGVAFRQAMEKNLDRWQREFRSRAGKDYLMVNNGSYYTRNVPVLIGDVVAAVGEDNFWELEWRG